MFFDHRQKVMFNMAKSITKMSQLTGTKKIYRMLNGEIEILFDNGIVAYIGYDGNGWLSYKCAYTMLKPSTVNKLYQLAKGEPNCDF